MRELVVLLIRAYQRFISPLFGSCCRYIPSCSEYAIESVRMHGLGRGGVLAVHRILRCHPFAGSGPDPVPESFHCPSFLKKSALSNGSPRHNG